MLSPEITSKQAETGYYRDSKIEVGLRCLPIECFYTLNGPGTHALYELTTDIM